MPRAKKGAEGGAGAAAGAATPITARAAEQARLNAERLLAKAALVVAEGRLATAQVAPKGRGKAAPTEAVRTRHAEALALAASARNAAQVALEKATEAYAASQEPVAAPQPKGKAARLARPPVIALGSSSDEEEGAGGLAQFLGAGAAAGAAAAPAAAAAAGMGAVVAAAAMAGGGGAPHAGYGSPAERVAAASVGLPRDRNDYLVMLETLKKQPATAVSASTAPLPLMKAPAEAAGIPGAAELRVTITTGGVRVKPSEGATGPSSLVASLALVQAAVAVCAGGAFVVQVAPAADPLNEYLSSVLDRVSGVSRQAADTLHDNLGKLIADFKTVVAPSTRLVPAEAGHPDLVADVALKVLLRARGAIETTGVVGTAHVGKLIFLVRMLAFKETRRLELPAVGKPFPAEDMSRLMLYLVQDTVQPPPPPPQWAGGGAGAWQGPSRRSGGPGAGGTGGSGGASSAGGAGGAAAAPAPGAAAVAATAAAAAGAPALRNTYFQVNRDTVFAPGNCLNCGGGAGHATEGCLSRALYRPSIPLKPGDTYNARKAQPRPPKRARGGASEGAAAPLGAAAQAAGE